MGSEDDSEGIQPAAAGTAGIQYVIRVRGHLDAHWSEWLDGMMLTHEAGGVTRLEGDVRDQAALYGLLNRLRDLSLTLISVRSLGNGGSDPPSPEEPPATR